MWYIVLYLVGYVLAYYTFRKAARVDFPNHWEYSDVLFFLALSLASWISLIAGLLILGCQKLMDSEFKAKPPKWL